MERLNIIQVESALNNFSIIITRTLTLAPALAHSAVGLISESTISNFYQAAQSASQNLIGG